MADDIQGPSPKIEPAALEAGEDAETRAARRELKQSSISDPTSVAGVSQTEATCGRELRDDGFAGDLGLRDRISSPKKKRAHDQVELSKDADDDVNSVASSDSARDRASRLEPEKKRHRDEDAAGNTLESPTTVKSQAIEDMSSSTLSQTKKSNLPVPSFTATGLDKLSAGLSPFASIGGPQKSVFSSSSSVTSSPFAFVTTVSGTSPSAVRVPPRLTFAGATSTSPFVGLSSGANGFGVGLSGGSFSSALSGGKGLTSFASAGAKSLQTEKPSKPFGAPESDEEEEHEEDDEDDDGDENGDGHAGSNDLERVGSPERESDEKKRLKLHKVEVDDGEAGETTLLSVRAKMFHHDKEAGWKERGAGMLKINAPQACVEFDEYGVPVPGSFDASGLAFGKEDADIEQPKRHKVVRLIMRQDQTHRVILNTALVPTMKFQEKTSLKSAAILFTAFEGEQALPVSVTMRMSTANAKSFINEISIVQRELQGN